MLELTKPPPFPPRAIIIPPTSPTQTFSDLLHFSSNYIILSVCLCRSSVGPTKADGTKPVVKVGAGGADEAAGIELKVPESFSRSLDSGLELESVSSSPGSREAEVGDGCVFRRRVSEGNSKPEIQQLMQSHLLS